MSPIYLFIYLFIHIIVCILILLLGSARVLKFSLQLMPIIICVPFFGVMVAIVADFNSRFHKTGSKVIQLEELRADDYDARIMKIQEDDDDQDITIPLEEAILINDTETRRKMMLDILHHNPNEYISLLQQARLNEDLEVTHYASTAIMEVQRDYELDLQKREYDFSKNPDNKAMLEACVKSIKRYIESGLIEDSVLLIRRRRYAELMELQMQFDPENTDVMFDATDNYIEIADFQNALKISDRLINLHPEDERVWIQRIKFMQITNNGIGLQDTIKTIRRRNIYLSAEGREVVDFWEEPEKLNA